MHLFMIRFVFHSGSPLRFTNCPRSAQLLFPFILYLLAEARLPSLSLSLHLGIVTHTYNCTCEMRVVQKSPTDLDFEFRVIHLSEKSRR